MGDLFAGCMTGHSSGRTLVYPSCILVVKGKRGGPWGPLNVGAQMLDSFLPPRLTLLFREDRVVDRIHRRQDLNVVCTQYF